MGNSGRKMELRVYMAFPVSAGFFDGDEKVADTYKIPCALPGHLINSMSGTVCIIVP